MVALPPALRAANFSLWRLPATGAPNSVPAQNAAGDAWEWRDLADASLLTWGTLDDARLSDNIPRKVNGKLQPSDLPSVALVNTEVVNSQAAMLALDAQTGDVAIRTDLSKSYILAGDDPAILANWQELLSPANWVSSVDLSLPSIFSVAGNPITSSGTLTATLNTQAANRVWAGPASGADAVPTFRALVAADLPAADGSNQGAMSAAHFTLVNNATAANTASALVRRDSSGNVALTGVTLDAATGAPLLNFSGDTTTGIGRFGSNIVSFYAGGNRNLDITSSQVSLNTLAIANSNFRVAGYVRAGNTGAPANLGSGGITGSFLNIGDVATSAVCYIGGNRTAASWATGGIGLAIPAATYTDSSSAGTVAATAVHSIGAPTLTSSNARTHTIASTLRIAGSPIAGTNTTITRPCSLEVVSGNSILAGYLAIGPNADLADLSNSWSQVVIRDTSTTNVGIKLWGSQGAMTLQSGTGGFGLTHDLTIGTFGGGGSLTTGSFWKMRAQDSTSTFQDQFKITSSWVSNGAVPPRKARVTYDVYDTAARTAMIMEASGSAPMIGFYGAPAIAKATISGSRSDGSALAAFLSWAQTIGLITDSTSA